jgi:hypothetical protein
MKKTIRRLLRKMKDPRKFVESALLALFVGTLIGSLAAFIHAAF